MPSSAPRALPDRAEPRRRMPAEDRRLAILRAAREAFAEGGFHRTSLEAVAERAGVSKALLYEHFDSKRELHAAMLELHVGELIAGTTEALAAAEPGEGRMVAGLDAFFSFLEEHRGAAAVMLRNTADPDVAEWLARLRDGIAAEVVPLMSEEMERLAAEDPLAVQMLAQQLIGAVQALADWWAERRDVPRERVVAAAMELSWVGLERLTAGERWTPPQA